MIINNSKKALAAKIKNSGFAWPDSGKWATQNKGGEVFVSGGIFAPVRRMGEANWEFGEPYRSAGILSLGSNWFQCILSRAEYFHLYPATDAGGWIEWRGGECPVAPGAIVEYLMVNDTADDLHADKAGEMRWSKSGSPGDIAFYRLYKSRTLQEVVGSGHKEPKTPTIEQLAADYRSKLAIAQKAREEADAANSEADAALCKLEHAGEAIGLLVSPIKDDIKMESSPSLSITDWRDLQVGDIIWCEAEDEYVQAGEKEVLGIEIHGYYGTRTIRVLRDGGRSYWINTDLGWHFIRRP